MASERVVERPAGVDVPTIEVSVSAASGPWVVEVGTADAHEVFPLSPGAVLLLGSGRGADVCIDDPTVSGRHVRLEGAPGGVIVHDLGSRNGTFFGQGRVASARLVGAVSSFVIGRTTVTVRVADEDDTGGVRFQPIPGLVGSSGPMRRLTAEIRRCAGLRAPVLLHGESGTGKDVVAGALHRIGRPSGPFVPLNVGGMTESLADADLFGHVRGAFTGAVAARVGAFEEANGGTLLLDEIADLSPAVQVKLLRVVESGQVRAVGGQRTVKVDTRLVSATWASLEERVAAGRFREDLFHRISTFVLRLPPLRERKSDIPALARALLARVRDDVGEKELSPDAVARLVGHSWPGNVRELGSVLYRAAVAGPAVVVGPEHVASAMAASPQGRQLGVRPLEAQAVLAAHGGNTSAAARSAGVPRSTFRSWLKRASEEQR